MKISSALRFLKNYVKNEIFIALQFLNGKELRWHLSVALIQSCQPSGVFDARHFLKNFSYFFICDSLRGTILLKISGGEIEKVGNSTYLEISIDVRNDNKTNNYKA